MILFFSKSEQPNEMNKRICKLKIFKKFTTLILILVMPVLLSSAQSFFKDLNQTEVLPADESFIFNAYKLSENRIILTWVMKENCFLYKDKFNILSNGNKLSADLILGEPERINDIYFGEVDVFFNSVEQEIKIKSDFRKVFIKKKKKKMGTFWEVSLRVAVPGNTEVCTVL